MDEMAQRMCGMIRVADAVAIAAKAARMLLTAVNENPGRIAICLTGGRTPKLLYDLLSKEICSRAIPWSRVHWFIGDERFVPRHDPNNNFNVAYEALLKGRAPDSHLHPIPTDCASPDAAARLYAAELQAFYGSAILDPRRPMFDIVFMGLGTDGHTASLFPGDPALDVEDRWAAGVPHANVPPYLPRVTLTRPVLASCRQMVFMVSGKNKRDILARLQEDRSLPAARVVSDNDTVWLHDISTDLT